MRDTKKQFADTFDVGDEQAVVDEPEAVVLCDGTLEDRPDRLMDPSKA